MQQSHINYDERGNIAIVCLNRPSKLNALNAEMLESLARIFREAAVNESLRALVLTGTGAEFSAGTDADIDLSVAGAREASQRMQRACDAIERCAVPVIAAVNGVAIGGGCALAFACHLRVAAREARFSLPEAHLGLLPAYSGTQRFPPLVEHGRALASMMAGEEMTAEEAHRLGVVNDIVETDDVVDAAIRLAERITMFAPLAVRACLRAVTEGTRLGFEQGLELEAELFSNLFATGDVREGTGAFMEKRKPVFKGK